MATFDLTTIANATESTTGGIVVKTWVVDFNEISGLASTDDVRLMAVPTGTAFISLASAIEVNRIYAGTSCAVDFGINGDAQIDSAVNTKVAAGTITLNSTNAAPVLYSNTSGATTYVTLEPTQGAADTTDWGKVTVTWAYIPISK